MQRASRGEAISNVDRLCFGHRGQLSNEFDELFRSLFRHAEHHIDVVRALALKAGGMSRGELVKSSGMSDGGGMTQTLTELEQCGFVRKFRDFEAGKGENLYQLVDPFTLFWLRFVEGNDAEGWWKSNYGGASQRAWSGYAFELVCLLHVRQILHAMEVLGVSHTARSWRSRRMGDGAQIDLVIDRADGVINLCEMKFSDGPFEITKSYEQQLLHKREVFARETQTRKALHLTLVTPHGLAQGRHQGVAQEVVTMSDLLWRP